MNAFEKACILRIDSWYNDRAVSGVDCGFSRDRGWRVDEVESDRVHDQPDVAEEEEQGEH